MNNFIENQNIVNENASSKFNRAIESRLTDKEWSASVASNVLRIRKKRVLRKYSAVAAVLAFLLAGISYGSWHSTTSEENGYAQLSQYLYADINYDYNMPDVLK